MDVFIQLIYFAAFLNKFGFSYLDTFATKRALVSMETMHCIEMSKTKKNFTSSAVCKYIQSLLRLRSQKCHIKGRFHFFVSIR